MLLIELFEDICPDDDKEVTILELRELERYLDQLFKAVSIDVDLTGRHFIERVNDVRNGRQITICELREIFKAFYREHNQKFKSFDDGFQAVIQDFNTNINLPFIIRYDEKNKELDLIAKTIMRKKNFLDREKPKLIVDINKNAEINAQHERRQTALVKAGLLPRKN
jgi:hypothetical protein